MRRVASRSGDCLSDRGARLAGVANFSPEVGSWDAVDAEGAALCRDPCPVSSGVAFTIYNVMLCYCAILCCQPEVSCSPRCASSF